MWQVDIRLADVDCVTLLENSCFRACDLVYGHQALVLVANLGELHELLALEFQQAHTHVGYFSVL